MENYISPEMLQLHLKKLNIRQEDIAVALNLSQGQVSRLIRGHFKAPGKAYLKICKYVKNKITASKKSDLSSNLTQAIFSVWDGSQEHAEMIAGVIRSLGPFRTNIEC